MPTAGRAAAVCLSMAVAAMAATLLDPVADERAVVRFGHARFTVLTDRLVRMEYSSSGLFEDSATTVALNRRMPVPSFTTEDHGWSVTLSTPYMSLWYAYSWDTSPFNETSLKVSVKGAPSDWSPGAVDSGNLLGTVRTLDSINGPTELDCSKADPVKSHCSLGVASTNGWALVDDVSSPLLDSQGWLVGRKSADDRDLYLFAYGRDFRGAVGAFAALSGAVPVPPRYSFGVFFSRWWGFNERGYKKIIREYEEHSTPLDVVVCDMDWHTTFYKEASKGQKDQAGQTMGWTGYSWDRHLIPYPSNFFAYLKQKGIRSTLNLHPAAGVQPWEDQYAVIARALDVDPASQRYLPYDLTNRTWAEAFLKYVLKPVMDQGPDFWWLDWQAWNTGNPTPTWWLNHIFFRENARLGKRERGTILHRWGGLGNHRYQLGFSGDVIPSWESLAFQPYFTATAANVLFGYWSHDLGGHTAPSPPELYTRWVQWGVWSPVFRTHCTKNAENDRRIWTYPLRNFEIMREAIVLRSRIVPYLYTEAASTHRTGVSLVHPLYYDYADAPQAYTNRHEYLFGAQFLVAPVTAPVDPTTGLVSWSVWLPPGKWVEWGSGESFVGPVTITRTYSLEETPVFVRPGAVIPMLPETKPLLGSAQQQYGSLVLRAYVGDGDIPAPVISSLYEDDGITSDYLAGDGTTSSTTSFSLSILDSRRRVHLDVSAASGSYQGMPQTRALTLELVGVLVPTAVTVNGQAALWNWLGDSATLQITLGPQVSTRQALSVDVTFASPIVPMSKWTRCLNRLQSAKEILDTQMSNSIYPEDFYNLLDAAESGERAEQRLDTARDEFDKFRTTGLPAAISDVQNLPSAALRAQLLPPLQTC